MMTFRCAGVSTTGEGVRCYRRVRAESEPAYCPQHTPGGREQAAALSAAEKAVVKAALAWHRATMRPRTVTTEALDAACAALARLEEER